MYMYVNTYIHVYSQFNGYIYIYIYIYIYTGCSPEELPEAMNDREKWRERVRDICAGGTT